MLPNWFESQSHFFERILPTDVPLRVLQIGVYTGDATQWLLDNRTIEFIDDVDTWEGSAERVHDQINFDEVYETYMGRHGNNPLVNQWRYTSDQFLGNIKDKSYNFIYIDGDHTAVQVALDALNAWRLLEKGGIMALDDYLWEDNPSEFLRPKRGIDAFLSVCQGEYQLIEMGYQVWIVKC
jgi:predicted O-methyltransferase YrrM